MKAYGDVDLWLHSFLISTLAGSECAGLHLSCLPTGKETLAATEEVLKFTFSESAQYQP